MLNTLPRETVLGFVSFVISPPVATRTSYAIPKIYIKVFCKFENFDKIEKKFYPMGLLGNKYGKCRAMKQ